MFPSSTRAAADKKIIRRSLRWSRRGCPATLLEGIEIPFLLIQGCFYITPARGVSRICFNHRTTPAYFPKIASPHDDLIVPPSRGAGLRVFIPSVSIPGRNSSHLPFLEWRLPDRPQSGQVSRGVRPKCSRCAGRRNRVPPWQGQGWSLVYPISRMV